MSRLQLAFPVLLHQINPLWKVASGHPVDTLIRKTSKTGIFFSILSRHLYEICIMCNEKLVMIERNIVVIVVRIPRRADPRSFPRKEGVWLVLMSFEVLMKNEQRDLDWAPSPHTALSRRAKIEGEGNMLSRQSWSLQNTCP